MKEMSLFRNIFTHIFLVISGKIARDTRNKKPTKVTKSHISFPKIEIEIEISIKFTTRLKPGVRAGDELGLDPKTMQILKNWLCWDLHNGYDWVTRKDWNLNNNIDD